MAKSAPNATPGFSSVQEVRNIQENFLAVSTSAMSTAIKELKDAITAEEIGRLEILLENLQREEQKLKDKLKLGTNDLTLLEQRIETWNKESLHLSFISGQGGEGKFKLMLDKIVEQMQYNWFTKNYTPALRKELYDSNSDFQTGLNNVIINDVHNGRFGEAIYQDIATFFQTNSKTKNNQGGINLHGKTDQLKAHLKIVIENEKDNGDKEKQEILLSDINEKNMCDIFSKSLGVQVTDIENLDPNFARQLATIIQRINGANFGSISRNNDVRQQIAKYIMGEIGGVPSGYNTPQNAIATELQRSFVNNQSIDIHRQYAATVGMFGEVYWNAFWKYITQNEGIVTKAVGSVRMSGGVGKGQEVPIDLVLDDIGFQIKNYTMKGGKNKYFQMPVSKKYNQIDEFMESRLELPSNLISPVQTFFFSYKYNQLEKEIIIGKNNRKRRRISSDAKDKYGDVRKRFSGLIKIFESWLEEMTLQRMDKVLGVDRQFQTQMGDLVSTDLEGNQYNTVYIIGNKFLFGSQIVQHMIYALKHEGDQGVDIVLDTFDFQIPKEGTRFDTVYPDYREYSASAAMKDVKVRYQFKIYTDKLFDSLMDALNSI